VAAQLAGLSFVDPCVVPPEICVPAAVLRRLKRQDRDACLLAITGRETEVFHGGFLAAVWAGADVAPSAHLCGRAGIKHGFTLDAFA